MGTFNAFMDKKQRDARKHLKILKKVFESNNMKVKDHLDNDDPYIFLYSENKDLNFDGLRIYKIGNQLAFRIQKEEHTHPFGEAYPLNVEDMFEDLMSDTYNADKAGKEVIKAIITEVQKFFKRTLNAEKDMKSSEFDNNNGYGVAIRGTVVDFSNLITTKGV